MRRFLIQGTRSDDRRPQSLHAAVADRHAALSSRESNMRLLEFRCNEFVEEFMYGNLRKQPLVRHWEGDTMSVDITCKVPPGDSFYQWYGR
jgi:hypothetical protein